MDECWAVYKILCWWALLWGLCLFIQMRLHAGKYRFWTCFIGYWRFDEYLHGRAFTTVAHSLVWPIDMNVLIDQLLYLPEKNNQVFLFKAILWDPFLLKLFFCIHILIFTGICLLYCITDILLFCMYSQTELDNLTSFWLNSFGAFLNQATFLFLCASKLGAVPQSPALGPEYVLPLLPPSLSINLSALLYWNCILSVLVSNPCPQRSDPGWVPTCPASPQLVSC